MSLMTCETKRKPLSCGQMLQQALDAYHQLLTGVTRVRVKHGESEVQYTQRSAKDLKEYVMGLHMRCGTSMSAAVLGIPSRRTPGVAVFGRTSFQEQDCCGCNTPPVVETCKDECNDCD